MECEHSYLVDPSTYDLDGLCNGIPVRASYHKDVAETGTFKAREDWKKYVGPLPDNSMGSFAPTFTAFAVILPECLPERVEALAYLGELGLFADDVLESQTAEESVADEADMRFTLDGLVSTGRLGRSSEMHDLQAKAFGMLADIDARRAVEVAKHINEFANYGTNRARSATFSNFDEIIAFRAQEAGASLIHASLVFGCNLTIQGTQLSLCHQLASPVWIALGLINDIYSYRREMKALKDHPDSVMTNSVEYMRLQHNLSEQEALLVCQQRTQEEVRKYQSNMEAALKRPDVSHDLFKYLELLQYTISGSIVWSKDCLRYNDNAVLSELQLQRLQLGEEMHLVQATERTSIDDTAGSRSSGEGNCHSPLDSGFNTSLGPDGFHSMTPTTTDEENEDFATFSATTQFGETLVREPYRYIVSMPSKNVRKRTIDSINTWLMVPKQAKDMIEEISQMLHQTSLMLDDIQDNSPLRRGKPSAHAVYGVSQTINSATFQYVEALLKVRSLSPECLDIFTDTLRELHCGQALDLYWTSNLICPSFDEYMCMVDKKTGALFGMIARLMAAESPKQLKVDTRNFTRLFGRFFQIRDDYQNLSSVDYSAQKGFCEDLDEGKYSLPMIHALQSCSSGRAQLQSLLSQRLISGSCTPEKKRLMLRHLQQAGSMEYTKRLLGELHAELVQELDRLSAAFGTGNEDLKAVIDGLSV